MADCIFCKIAKGEIPAKIVYEDDRTMVFADLNPQAPTHLLVIPREHIASLADMQEPQAELIGHLQFVAATVAKQSGLRDGFRTVMNTGRDGGQTVGHLHVHLLGGRHMGWPPG